MIIRGDITEENANDIIETLNKIKVNFKPGEEGKTECPVCGKELYFRRSIINGHVHADCVLESCIKIIE